MKRVSHDPWRSKLALLEGFDCDAPGWREPRFFSGSSSQASQQTTSGTTAGAQSPSIAGNKNQQTSSTGNTSPVLSGAGAQLSNTQGDIFQVASGAKVSITTPPDQSGELAAISALQQSVSSVGDSLEQSQSDEGQTQSALAALTNAAVASSQAQSANTSSGGQTDNNATIVKVVAWVAAAVVAVFLLPKLLSSRS